MKNLKSLLVSLIVVSLVFPPSLTAPLFAQDKVVPPDDDQEQRMPVYQEPYRSPQDSVQLEQAPEPPPPPPPPPTPPPAEEDEEQENVLAAENRAAEAPEEAPEAPENAPEDPQDLRVGSAGDTIPLSNGVTLTEQQDGTYRDEDNNKWIMIEDEDGSQSYRQLGFPEGTEIELTDGTTLTSAGYFEYSEEGELPNGVEFKDEQGSTWKTYDNSFRRIDYPANTEIPLEGGTVLKNLEPFKANDDGSLPDGIKFKDEKGNTWITRDGMFSQTSFQAGDYELELTKADGTKVKLTNTQSFEFTDEGKFPENIWFEDEQGNRWTTYQDSINQIDYPAGTEIPLADGTILKNTNKFEARPDGTFPDGVELKDQDGNRWNTYGGKFVRIDYAEGAEIPLEGGTVLTVAKAFVANPDGTLPDGAELKDQDGNKWITAKGTFKQVGFSANAISYTLTNGWVLTNTVPFELNADGTMPAGVLLKDDTYGYTWVTNADGTFQLFDPKTTPFSSLQIVQMLQSRSAKDAATLLAACDPTVARMVVLGASLTDQQVADIFKEMDSDSLVALLNTSLKLVDPLAGRSHNNVVVTYYNDITDPRLISIFSSLDVSKQAEIISNDALNANLAGVILTQSASQQMIDLWNALPSDRAAAIANTLFALDVFNPAVGGGLSNPPYGLDAVEIARIKTMGAILAAMDPAKAAALLDSGSITLTNAAKLMLGVPSHVPGYDAEGNPVSLGNPFAALLTALTALNPERAQNVQEVVAYLGTIKENYWNGGPVQTPEGNYNAQLATTRRPLTASEQAYYTTLFGSTPTTVTEIPSQDGTIQRTFTYAGQWLTGTSGTSTINSAGVETFSVDVGAKIAALSTEEAAKMLDFLGNATAASVLAGGALTVDKTSEILGELGAEKTGIILASMDKTNAVKADDLRVKMGIDPDLATMSADEVAEYLAGLDLAKAAVKLSKLEAGRAAEIIASDSITAEQVSKILGAMIDLATTVTPVLVWDDMSETMRPTGQTKTTIDTSLVAEILSWKSADEDAAFQGLAADKAAEILLGLGAEKAVLVLNSDKMSAESAGAILTEATKSDAQQATYILLVMDLTNKAKADQVRAEMGAVPGTMTPEASAVYLSILDPTVAAAELAKLTDDEAAAILASPQMSPVTAANILIAAGAVKAAGYITSDEMSVEAAVAILTRLKISDGFRFTELMSQLALDEANKDKVGQIITEMNKVPSSQQVSSAEQARLTAIYGYTPAFYTKETTTDAATGNTTDTWKYYDANGTLIGTRVDANPARLEGYIDDSETARQRTVYDGYSATYYDINGNVITKTGNFSKLSADQANSLTDLFQAEAVYVQKVLKAKYAGGGSSGAYNYYDENFNLIGSKNYSNDWRGINGFVETISGSYDRNGTQIAIGTGAMTSYKPGGTTSRTITAGSAEEQSLLATFGVAPASARDFTEASYVYGSNAAGWATSGPITTYYDKDGNYLGSKKTTYGSDWNGNPTSADTYYDKNGNAIAANGYGALPAAPHARYNCATYALAELAAGKSLDEISAALEPYTTNGLTSLLGLKTIASEYGLDMEAVKTQFPNLVKDTDAIVHFTSGHYVKLVSYDEAAGMVTYKDNGVLKTVTEAEFAKNFSGYALMKKALADAQDIIGDTEAGGVLGSDSSNGAGENGSPSVVGGSAGIANGNANSFSSGGGAGGGGCGTNGGVSFGYSYSTASSGGGSSTPTGIVALRGADGLLSGPGLTNAMRAMNIIGNAQWSSSNVNNGNPMHGLAKGQDGTYTAIAADPYKNGVQQPIKISFDVAAAAINGGVIPAQGFLLTGSEANNPQLVESLKAQGFKIEGTDEASGMTYYSSPAQAASGNATVSDKVENGHRIINLEDGTRFDINLSDNSYTIWKYNQQVGSGSAGALEHFNPQAVAQILGAGLGVPDDFARMLYEMPGNPADWSYTSSKGNVDYYFNSKTGETIELASDPDNKGWYSWSGAGSEGVWFNVHSTLSKSEGQVLGSKITGQYFKYEHLVTAAEAFKAKYGINLYPETLAELEQQLKMLGSQHYVDVDVQSIEGGVICTEYLKNGDKELLGKRVYTFTYDENGEVSGGSVGEYGYSGGKWSFEGDATLAPDGTYEIPAVERRENILKNNVTNDGKAINLLKSPSGEVSYEQYLRDENGAIAGRLTYTFTYDKEGNGAIAGEVKQEIFESGYWVTVKNAPIKADGSFEVMTAQEMQRRLLETLQEKGRMDIVTGSGQSIVAVQYLKKDGTIVGKQEDIYSYDTDGKATGYEQWLYQYQSGDWIPVQMNSQDSKGIWQNSTFVPPNQIKWAKPEAPQYISPVW